MKAQKLCKILGCTRIRSNRGLCPAHYQRQRICGDVRADERVGGSHVHRRECSIDKCTDLVKGRGFCQKHYAQWRRKRDSGKACSVSQCSRPAISQGLCNMHYTRKRTTGSSGEALPRKRDAYSGQVCSIDGCARSVLARNWCALHYDRWRARGDPLAPPKKISYSLTEKCIIEGCNNHPSAKRLCKAHYGRWRARGMRDINRPVIPLMKAKGMTCSGSNCDAPVYSRGLCSFHYGRQRKYGDPYFDILEKSGHIPSLRERNKLQREGMKLCCSCREIKSHDQFTKSKNEFDSLNHCCKLCTRSNVLQRKYGLTTEQFDTILQKQNGKCAICRRERKDGDRPFHVDHDHKTGIVRGILCNLCNRYLLGVLEVNNVSLSHVAQYLESNALDLLKKKPVARRVAQ